MPATKAPEDLLRKIRQGNRFLLTSHVNPDGDAIGSELGLARLLRRLGKGAVVWNLDPILLPFRDLPTIGRTWGYAGPPGRASAEAVTKYVIVDMYAKAIQGMAAEEAVKWAHDELVKIYV